MTTDDRQSQFWNTKMTLDFCVTFRYAICMTQLVTRIDNDLASDVDSLVAMGVVKSRSDAVRQGLRSLIDEHHRKETADAIIGGYRNTPQSADEFAGADSATRRMITDEPW